MFMDPHDSISSKKSQNQKQPDQLNIKQSDPQIFKTKIKSAELKFDVSQVKFFVDSRKKSTNILSFHSKESIGNSSKSSRIKSNTSNSIQNADKLSEKEKQSASSKSSISKQHSQDSKDEKITEGNVIKEDSKKRTSFTPSLETYDITNKSIINTMKTEKPLISHKYSNSLKFPIKTINNSSNNSNVNLNNNIVTPTVNFKMTMIDEEENKNDNTNQQSFGNLKTPPNMTPTPQKIIKFHNNYSNMSYESTHDTENINTLTSSNSGHYLENYNNFLLGKSDMNSPGKTDTSGSEQQHSGRGYHGSNLYLKNSLNYNKPKSNLMEKLGFNPGVASGHKISNFMVNQTINEGIMKNQNSYRGRDIFPKFAMNININKSMNFDGEIKELYEQEEENLIGKEINDEINFGLKKTDKQIFYTSNNNNESNLSFFKENPRHKKKTEEEDASLFLINIKNIEKDGRTTLMIKNIPNKYNKDLILQTINRNYKDKWDFFYLPIDFKNKCNVGYAFINFIDTKSIKNFYEEFSEKKWEKFNSEKICEIKYARIQGRDALIHHFQSSSVMNQKDKKLRPLILPDRVKSNIEKLINQQRENITDTN